MGRLSALLALILAAAFASFPAHAAGCKLEIIADLPVTMEEGRRASVPVRINNHATSFWLDSGVFFSIMPRSKAADLELPLAPLPAILRDIGFHLIGIGGSAELQMVTIRSFGLLKHDMNNVQFLVGGTDAGNGLIGRNILAFRDTEFDLAHGSVKIMDAIDCKTMDLAYWAPGKQFFTAPLLDEENGRNVLFRLPVIINGKKIIAEFDTGAPSSLLSRRAAEMAKINLKDPDATPLHHLGGFGTRTFNGWSAPVADVGVGDEHVLNTRLDVIDGPIEASPNTPEMLLGADFALAHHIYVSRRNHLIFFTYSGGLPFITSDSARIAKHAASGTSSAAKDFSGVPAGMHEVTAVDAGAEPKTADEFARRGNARLTQQRFSDAIQDLGEAIRLEPGNADYYRQRAVAYELSRQIALAKQDIDKAIALDPTQGTLLIVRSEMRFAAADRAGALADAEAAAKVTPPSSLSMAKVADWFAHLGKPGRAADLIGPVIATHTEDARYGALLSARCWFRGLANVELDKALDDCNRAVHTVGAAPAVLDSRALIRYRRGDLTAAITDYDAALKKNPRETWSLFMRGAAKAKQGDVAGAKADQDAARTINPKIGDDAAVYGLP